MLTVINQTRFVVAHEILEVPVEAAHSPRFSRMAHEYCHMFANAPPTFKDLWGSSFFEAWALTILIALQVGESYSFRDFCGALVLSLGVGSDNQF